MRLLASGSPVRATLAALLVVVPLGCSSGGGSVEEPTAGAASGQGGGGAPDRESGSLVPGGPSGADSTGTGDRLFLSQAEIARRVFDPAVTDFVVNAFYETGAEPYVGRLGLSADDTWDITAESYRDLFAAHAGRSLSIPSTLDQMQEFADQGIESWDVDALVALGESLVPPLVAGDRAQLSVLFVNGLFDGNEAVLGVHVANTHYAFVFKDVVESVGGDAMTQRYAEQATVVHELGHAIGFTDNGVPMVNEHEDADHRHHTTNRECVMYWAVESRSGVLAFLTDAITGARLGLFGSETLLDAQNFMPDN